MKFFSDLAQKFCACAAKAKAEVQADSARHILMAASEAGSPRDVAMAIQMGADLAYENDQGLSALDLAKDSGDPETLRLLEEAGCRPGSRLGRAPRAGLAQNMIQKAEAVAQTVRAAGHNAAKIAQKANPMRR